MSPLCSSLPERSVKPITLAPPPFIVSHLILTITYIHTGSHLTHIYRVGSTTIQHITCTGSWVTATSGVGVMKMGNVVPWVGIEPIFLAFRASVLTITPCRLPDVTTIHTPSVYAAPCFRGQRSLLQYPCGGMLRCNWIPGFYTRIMLIQYIYISLCGYYVMPFSW